MIWGNTKGWIISGIITVFFCGVVGLTEYLGQQTSKPTRFGLSEKNRRALELPESVRSKAGTLMTASGDAATYYEEAIRDYADNKLEWQRAMDGRNKELTQQQEAFGLLVEATPMRNYTLFESEPSRIIRYTESEALTALKTIGDLMITHGARLQARDQYAKAERFYKAGFMLGYRLSEQRFTHAQLAAGRSLLTSGAAGMMSLEQKRDNGAEAQGWKLILDDMTSFTTQQTDPIWRVLGSVDPKITGRHNGDYYYFATEAQNERMWRIQAILKVGKLRFDVGDSNWGGSNQRQALGFVQRYVDDSDPYVAAAAKAAVELTVDEFHMSQN